MTIKSIKVQKDKADTKSKKKYKTATGEVRTIHNEIKSYLTGINKENTATYTRAKASTSAANSALQAQLSAGAATNASEIDSSQARLGISGAGRGSFDADSAFNKKIAAQSGADQLSNLSNQGVSSAGLGNMLSSMNMGQRGSALKDQKDLYTAEKDANKEAYTQMVTDYKKAEAFKASQTPFVPYGGGGGSNFVPYGRGGGRPFVPYARRPYVPYASFVNGKPKDAKNAKIPLTAATLPTLLGGLGKSFDKNKKKESQRMGAIQKYYNNKKYGGKTYN